MGTLTTNKDCIVYFQGYFDQGSIGSTRSRLRFSDPIPDIEIPYLEIEEFESELEGQIFVAVTLDRNRIPEQDKRVLFRGAITIFLKPDSYEQA